MRSWLRDHWIELVAIAFVGLWAAQCATTRAARKAYADYRDGAQEREAQLSGDLAVSTDSADRRLERLEAMLASNDTLRAQRDSARRVAQAHARELQRAQPVAHANTDDALEEIERQFPAAIPLVKIVRTNLAEERQIGGRIVDAVSEERDSWKADALTYKAERDEAVNETIPGLQAALADAVDLAEERLQRALRAESEYDREVRSGFLDIGIPDWAGTVLGVGVGVGAGIIIDRLAGG